MAPGDESSHLPRAIKDGWISGKARQKSDIGQENSDFGKLMVA